VTGVATLDPPWSVICVTRRTKVVADCETSADGEECLDNSYRLLQLWPLSVPGVASSRLLSEQ